MVIRSQALPTVRKMMRCQGYQTVPANEPLKLAALDQGLPLIVVNQAKTPIGLISTSICSVFAKILTRNQTASIPNADQVMRAFPQLILPEASFSLCLELFQEEPLELLPVVESEQVIGVVFLVDVVREQQEQLQNLNWDHNQLRKELQQKEEYLGVLSHDIRTPLSVISLSCDFLLSSTQLAQSDATTSSFIERIQRNCDNASKMVNEILDSLREEHTQNNVRQEIDVGPFVSQIVQNLQLIAKQKSVSIQVECFSTYQLAMVASQIQHVLENILMNAIKFSPENGRIFVSINHEKIDTEIQLLIAVRDEGPGIRDEDRHKIFEKFEQSEQKRTSSGVGLGLFIAKKFVRAHGGSIEVTPVDAGTGAIFQVRLPGPVIVSNEAKQSNSRHQSLLLMVEDDPDLLEYFSEALRQYNLTVVTAENGEQGFQEYLRHKPDIVLTDIMMPQVDGLEMLAKIRNHDEHHHVPVILFTGFYPGLFEDLAEAPFQPDHVIQKPATVEELADLISQFLQTLQKAS